MNPKKSENPDVPRFVVFFCSPFFVVSPATHFTTIRQPQHRNEASVASILPRNSYREDPKVSLWIFFGGGMAGKIVELRAALLVSGAVYLVHPGAERKALIRAMPSRERGNPLKVAFLAQNRFHLSISWCLFFSIFLLYK